MKLADLDQRQKNFLKFMVAPSNLRTHKTGLAPPHPGIFWSMRVARELEDLGLILFTIPDNFNSIILTYYGENLAYKLFKTPMVGLGVTMRKGMEGVPGTIRRANPKSIYWTEDHIRVIDNEKLHGLQQYRYTARRYEDKGVAGVAGIHLARYRRDHKWWSVPETTYLVKTTGEERREEHRLVYIGVRLKHFYYFD